jgi:hypothetical protein
MVFMKSTIEADLIKCTSFLFTFHNMKVTNIGLTFLTLVSSEVFTISTLGDLAQHVNCRTFTWGNFDSCNVDYIILYIFIIIFRVVDDPSELTLL